MMQQQMMAAQNQGANPEKPNAQEKSAPIKGEGDAQRFVAGQ